MKGVRDNDNGADVGIFGVGKKVVGLIISASRSSFERGDEMMGEVERGEDMDDFVALVAQESVKGLVGVAFHLGD